MSPVYLPVELRRHVRADAAGRCGYCHTPETLIGMPLEFEHLHPAAHGGATVRANLWLACTRCNDFKGDRVDALDLETGETVPLFNPRTQVWVEHFAWSPDGTLIIGVTSIGRATVVALKLNNEYITPTNGGCPVGAAYVTFSGHPTTDRLDCRGNGRRAADAHLGNAR